MKLGFIGLGIMGAPMAGHLLAAGHELFAHSRSGVPAALREAGAKACDTAADVARAADIVFLMVPDTPHVAEVLFGESGLDKGLTAGKTVVDMSSISPIATKDFAKRIQALGCDYIDAPVSGGEVGAKAASLTIMVGATEASFATVKPLFELMGAALYPAIVSLISIVIVLFLVSYVVPQVASVFAGTKRALPFLTVAMLGLSAVVRSYGWLMLIAAILIAAGARWALTIEHFRQKFDAAWLNLPLVGKLARGYNAARFASTLAMLASAGVPILKALQAAAETLNNRALRADALDALVLVREGAPLASALAQKKRFPGLLSMFARLGEQTGQLPVMLQRAAKQLSTEVQRRAMQLATILEPLLIVAMGLVVMLIVLAVLLPIIQLNQFMK
jgi:hypothetical protein